MADRVITVPQATQIAQATKGQLNSLNERLTQQAETIEDLTMRLSEAEALLNIARGEGGS